MNMKASTLIALAISGSLFAAGANAITGTTSVKATFTSTVEAGTCSAQIQSAGGQPISTLAFGDVYKSELVAKTRSEPFKIAFSDCAGVKSASITATPGAGSGCSGTQGKGDSFAAGHVTAFEVWKGQADSGTLMSCNSRNVQTVSLDSAAANVDMVARIVVASGRSINDVTTGDVSAPVTFVVTYQ